MIDMTGVLGLEVGFTVYARTQIEDHSGKIIAAWVDPTSGVFKVFIKDDNNQTFSKLDIVDCRQKVS